MTIAEKIKQYRLIHKMTQNELGKESGIGEATIRKYELGIRNPKPAQLQRIADAMGIPVGVLADDDIIKSNYSTVADVLFALFMLDSQTNIKILGDRNKDNKLIANTISLQFDNDYLNELISDWELVKSAYEDEFAKHGHLEEEIFKYRKENLDVKSLENLENYMNFRDFSDYQESIKMWLISRGDVPLEKTNNKKE
jgi:transcriptional regulator with XRE-family HTH domain